MFLSRSSRKLTLKKKKGCPTNVAFYTLEYIIIYCMYRLYFKMGILKFNFRNLVLSHLIRLQIFMRKLKMQKSTEFV